MKKKTARIKWLLAISLIIFFPTFCSAYQVCRLTASHAWNNPISPRFQWNHNSGYCGEVSLISAGLYYGQYLSQYDVRAVAIKNKRQNKGQLLLGVNDQYTAAQLRLNSIEWNTADERNTDQFLVWVKQQVIRGYPVAIGLYTNEYLFYRDTDPDAGDPQYDHIVPVTGIASKYSLSDPNYYGSDIINFSDNGLWGDSSHPPYHFSYSFDAFQANRQEANAANGSIYSLPVKAGNYGIALTGVMDVNGDTLPVQVQTSANNERPQIQNGSTTRPPPMPLTLTVIVTKLKPGILYHLYRYNDLSAVPNSNFNAQAYKAYEKWPIIISAGTTYVMTQDIKSNEMAIYRAVKASAP